MSAGVLMRRRGPALAATVAFGVAFALLSATAKPSPKRLAALLEAGVEPAIAAALLHVAPVALVMAIVLVLGLAPLKGGARVGMLAIGGGVAGFVLSLCLDVFAATAGWLASVTGPLPEAGRAEYLGWSLTLLLCAMGLGYLGFAAFGRTALEVMAIRPVSAEQAEVTRADRANVGRGAWALLAMGIGLGALTLLRQAEAAPLAVRLALGAAFALAFGAACWQQWRLYRETDELLRLATLQAYALSGVAATIGLGVWAVAAEIARGAGPSPFEAFIAFFLVQTVGSLAVSARSVGSGMSCDGQDADVAPLRADA